MEAYYAKERRDKPLKYQSILVNGGEKGIRTLETVTRLHTFQACAFDHSAISPLGGYRRGPVSQSLAAERRTGGRPVKGARTILMAVLAARAEEACGELSCRSASVRAKRAVALGGQPLVRTG